jgi:putative heme-binding domain-containing protein
MTSISQRHPLNEKLSHGIFQIACLSTLVLALIQAARLGADESSQSARFRASEPSTPKEVYGQTIRETQKLTANEEKAGFHLPAGFQIELIASEPTIAKPMNMAFDGSGKLWVAQSTQYPFPAKPGEVAGDSIVVLEDRDRDGSFESSHVFADQLNIPIGILPYQDGVLCFSIPNIWFLRDTDGDGKCDERTVLIGPFDTTRDTHGMVNALRDGHDGWIYACHGFNNESKIQGRDGHAITMTSGNTFRFRPDGSRVELYTQGQVNPFGMAQDRWGFWYAADCHSKPISQLIAGGCYPSFGRPDDGLGFVPPMMDHLHGSTAISGLAHSKNSRFPVEFQDNFLSGNVMTCRINRNQIQYSGATAKAIDMPDLLTSDDPWFRPVDLQFGPDGKLYIADFYNKIIGHYEVPLDHPDRDRTSGRIWRISWVGEGDRLEPLVDDSTKIEGRLPWDEIKSLSPIDAKSKIDRICNSLFVGSNNVGLLEEELISALRFADALDSKNADQAMLLQSIAQLLSRSAAMGSKVAQEAGANWLMQELDRVDATLDPVLAQSLVISLRGCLQSMQAFDSNRLETWLKQTTNALREKKDSLLIKAPRYEGLLRVLLAIKNPITASAILDLLEMQIDNQAITGMDSLVDRLADVIDDANVDRLFLLIDRMSVDLNSASDWIHRLSLRQKSQRGMVLEGLSELGRSRLPMLCKAWMIEAEKKRKQHPDWCMVQWNSVPGISNDQSVWGLEQRQLQPVELTSNLLKTNHGQGTFYSSLTRGEKYVGTWKTAPFMAPERLAFRIVGHNGLPSEPDQAKNLVRMVLLDATGDSVQEIARAFPPRSDVAARVEWDLKAFQGKPVEVQVIDGDSGNSYAWIGVGEFEQEGLNPGSLPNRWKKIEEFIELFGWPSDAEHNEILEALGTTELVDTNSRIGLQILRYQRSYPVLVELAEFALQQNWADIITVNTMVTQQNAIASNIAKRCSAKQQEQLVKQLSRHRDAANVLAELCTNGSLSREALAVLQPSFWQSLHGPSAEKLIAMRPTEQTNSSRQAVVDSKATAIPLATVDLELGQKQFADRCATCHKLGNQGRVVGPQLEGVGARGIPRLCEDILWPDRNVDEAFRMTLLVLEGGETVSGLVTDRNSESMILTDQAGKQRRILVSEIEQEKQSKLSLMPGNFEELMSNDEMASLIGYLRKEAGLVPITNE